KASWAVAPIMTVSFAADGSDCATQVPPFTPFSFYAGVLANNDVLGITGAEFRIANVDPTWFSTVTPNPAANLSLGSPIGPGANIAFPVCQSVLPGQFVLLYSIQSFAISTITPRDLQIVQHSTPSNPSFQCPLVT